jgi:hypothetical protein
MTHRKLVSFGATLIALGLVMGCRLGSLGSLERSTPAALEPTAPLNAGTHGGAFYPLDLGDRWHYARTYDVRWQDASGAPHAYHVDSAIERELACDVPLGTRSYAAERTLELAPGATYLSWIYYRQDRRGLYEADNPVPPPCESVPPPEETGPGLHVHIAPLSSIAEQGKLPEDPGVLAAMGTLEQRLSLVRYTLGLPAPSLRRPRPAPGEIVRLAYPLYPGQRWIIRAQPRFTSRVEGVDVLRLPAGRFVAYRIRIDSELFGPNDRVHVWYGRQGFLRLDFHGESQGVDDYGNPLDYAVVSEDHEVLDGIALVGDHSD